MVLSWDGIWKSLNGVVVFLVTTYFIGGLTYATGVTKKKIFQLEVDFILTKEG